MPARPNAGHDVRAKRRYGSGRARVQNNLVAKGLAQYVDEEGRPVRPTAFGFCPQSWLADRCVITDAGRARLKADI